MSTKWQANITGILQYADYSKMVVALKVVVVRREQILAYFYILSIKIQFENINYHIGNHIFL